jgi:hypothetical protein
LQWYSWLSHCTTSRKVAGLIPNGVIGYFIDQTLWPHYGPGVDSASNRNEYQDYFLGGRGSWCTGLTTLPCSWADCPEIWEPHPSGTRRACTGIYLGFTSLMTWNFRMLIITDETLKAVIILNYGCVCACVYVCVAVGSGMHWKNISSVKMAPLCYAYNQSVCIRLYVLCYIIFNSYQPKSVTCIWTCRWIIKLHVIWTFSWQGYTALWVTMPCSLVAGQSINTLPLLNYTVSHRGVNSIKIRDVTFTKRDKSVESVHCSNPQTERYNTKNEIHTELTWIRVP